MCLKQKMSKRIKSLRKSLQWTKSDLARKAKISCAAIHQIEKGVNLPSLMIAIRLAEAFNIPLSELVDDSQLNYFSDKDKFLLKFKEIKKLKEDDQKLILSLTKRLIE